MTAKALVGGVGMIKFKKPGENEGYEVMSEKAIRLALEDAGIAIDDIQQAYASYCYGDSANGQSGFYRVKRTGIPIFNVNNNCASGSNALFLARQAVESGMADCVIAYGFEQMVPGALTSHWTDRYSPAIPVSSPSSSSIQTSHGMFPVRLPCLAARGLNIAMSTVRIRPFLRKSRSRPENMRSRTPTHCLPMTSRWRMSCGRKPSCRQV